MNEPLTFYTSRIADLKRALSQINKKEIVLSYSRLASFIAALLSFALLFTFSAVAATVTGVIFLILFAWLVKYHNNVIGDRTFHEHLIKVNEAEAAALEGDYSSLPDGSEYIKAYRDHYYSFDLDIFGGNSLYRLVNRTSTKPGSDLMAEWLTEPAGVEEVRERQEAVSDMRERIEWRQKLQVAGSMHRDSGRDPSEIIRWTRSPETFKSNGFLKLAINVLSILVLASLVLQFFGLPLAVTVLLLTVNFMVNFIFQKRINDMHAKVSRSSDMLNSYASVISLIEKENFISRKLVGLQDNLRTGGAASKQIKELSQLVRNLDVRLNVLVSVFLNLFWFWDIRMCYRMEAWKGKNTPFIQGWFDVMAEMEALASFANLSFNNAEWVMPTVREGNFHLDAVEAGHPLIPRLKRVSNDLKITGPGKLLLITGSNMSGKSTFLRTIGVNLVLAYAGSVVCATSFKTGQVKLITSMRVSDSLEENTSTFYAELKRLSMIIRETSTSPSVFLLLDEILHGTNSNDRHIGSVALVKQLIKNQASGMVATHDLALSSLEREHPGEISNYNFDVKIEGEELYFDYKLNRGICSSMNATLLMKKMGIDIK